MIREDERADFLRLGRALAELFLAIEDWLEPGVKGETIDDFVRQFAKRRRLEPAFLGYRPKGGKVGYPAALCLSINHEIVHGLPEGKTVKPEDVLSLDIGLTDGNLFVDAARTYLMPEAPFLARTLLLAAEQALELGIKAAQVGLQVNAISQAIGQAIVAAGFQPIKELSGHGISHSLHEEPLVPNWPREGNRAKLKPYQALAIEPMISSGKNLALSSDGWTVLGPRKSLAVHLEETVLLEESGPKVVTRI